ncbi:MAG: recombinase family protein [Gemmatimonadetes bacterium]|nr:recombinase family protein [Gemmatimonadota bacterium]
MSATSPLPTISPKITAAHLQRRAFVYVRQSTMTQVHEHLESQRRQYALSEQARTWGWQQVEVIDEDLGRFGPARGASRFERLVAAVPRGSRRRLRARRPAPRPQQPGLASSGRPVRADRHAPDRWRSGIYDPRDFNDRLLLGPRGR